MADLFGINDYQWGTRTTHAKHDAKYGRTEDLKHITAAQKNPEQYTLYQPHGGAKPAFTFDDWGSGGIDDNDYDEVIPIYKIPQPEPASTPAPEPAPTPEPTPEPKPELPVKLSERAADANAYTDAYERKVLPYKGNYIFGDESVEQNFKNQYQTNLTNELKTKNPNILDDKAKEIKANDREKLDYSLKLGEY